MTERDPAIESLGITVQTLDDGTVSAALVVQPDMTNRHGVCHGGILFLLADAVMDYSTNASLDSGHTSFAAHAEVDYVRAGMVDDTLTATGAAPKSWGRTNLVDVTVTNQDGAVVALFRGRTRTVDSRKRS